MVSCVHASMLEIGVGEALCDWVEGGFVHSVLYSIGLGGQKSR